MSRHSNHSIKLHTTAESGGAIVIGTIGSMADELNSQVIAPETGDPYQVAQLMVGQAPEQPFTTCCIKAILDAISSLLGKCITSDGSHPGIVLYGAKHDQCGVAGRASANHLSKTIGLGHVFIESITAERGGLAMLSGRVHGVTSDPSVSPVITAFNATLPSDSDVINDEFWGLGKALLANETLHRIERMSMNFNPKFEKSNDADSIWPSLIDPQQIQMVTEFVTEDPEIEDIIPRNGLLVDHTDTEIYLLRRPSDAAPESGGGFADFATNVHIQGTLKGLAHITTPYTASGTGTSRTTIQIAGLKGDSTAPVVWDTTAVYGLG